MGNGTSSSNVCDAQTHNNVKNYSLKHVINAEETADHFRRSRTEEENGGKSYDDNVSIRSKDSDDTVVISERMSSYRDRGRINDGNTGENTPGDISKQNTKENEVTAWKKTLNHMDIIKRIAAENYTDPNEDIYEVDTIGYYISQDVTGNEEGHAESIDKDNNESQTTQAEKKQQLNSDSNSNKDDDRFKIVKKIYTNTHHKNRRKSAVANKQTLILAKVGTQYKYVAVPAYLPGQKLYPSKAFAKPYMERSEYLYKVKRQKGANASVNANMCGDIGKCTLEREAGRIDLSRAGYPACRLAAMATRQMKKAVSKNIPVCDGIHAEKFRLRVKK